MKFQGIFVALFLSSTLVDSSSIDSTTDPPPSSRLSTDSKIGDDARHLENASKKSKMPKQHPKSASKKSMMSKESVKKSVKKNSLPTPAPTVAGLGALFSKPHKFKYEKVTLCLPGIRAYGCADAASQENGGEHLHEVIRGRRFVKHQGAFVGRSLCDYQDEITEGVPPVIVTDQSKTIARVTSDDGSIHMYQLHSKRDEECAPTARTLGSSPTMKDPNEYFEFERIVVENGMKYKMYVSRLADQMTTDEHKRALHLIQAGLVPDTIVYLEDMEGTPYGTRGYSGSDLLHETRITNFELLTPEDTQRSMEEITRSFAGETSTRNISSQTYSEKEVSTGTGNQNRELAELNIYIPESCDDTSEICLEISEVTPSISDDGSGFDIQFFLNVEADSVSLAGGFRSEEGADPKLLSANANAEGCLGEGIKGKVDLDIQLCLEGGFTYDAATDKSPSEQAYEVDMSFTASAEISGVGLELDVSGKFTMKVENANENTYFIGYDGFIDAKVSFGIATVGLGVGLNYETPSYLQYKEQNGWATKFYGQIQWGVDLYFWSDGGTISHVFSCEPASNSICSRSGIPNPLQVPGEALLRNERIKYNEYLLSPAGDFKLFMQPDGNLVIYAPGQRAVWATGTNGQSIATAIFQDDGNLVLYTNDNPPKAAWASNTNGGGGFILYMQNDGNLVIYNQGGDAIWATNTCDDC